MLMSKQDINVDTLYVNGCSWTYGSELVDPSVQPPGDHFQPVHDKWRREHAWPGLLSNILNLGLSDGSICGSSNQRILRTSIQDLARLQLQGYRPIAVIAWSQIQRFELNNGSNWEQFLSPNDRDRLPLIEDLMGHWWHDSALIENWCVQAVSLAAICYQMGIPLFMTFTFTRSHYTFSDMMRHRRSADLLSLIREQVKPEQHCLNTSMEELLMSFGDKVPHGPGGHPLEYGHEVMAQWFRREIYSRFNFIT